MLALYLVFFLLPFFFFPVELLDTIATSNLQLSAISLFIILYALRMPPHLSFSKCDLRVCGQMGKCCLFVFVEVEYGDLYVPHIDGAVVVNVSIGIPVD